MLACHVVAPRSGRCIQSCLDMSGWCHTALQLTTAWCTGFALNTYIKFYWQRMQEGAIHYLTVQLTATCYQSTWTSTSGHCYTILNIKVKVICKGDIPLPVPAHSITVLRPVPNDTVHRCESLTQGYCCTAVPGQESNFDLFIASLMFYQLCHRARQVVLIKNWLTFSRRCSLQMWRLWKFLYKHKKCIK